MFHFQLLVRITAPAFHPKQVAHQLPGSIRGLWAHGYLFRLGFRYRLQKQGKVQMLPTLRLPTPDISQQKTKKKVNRHVRQRLIRKYSDVGGTRRSRTNKSIFLESIEIIKLVLFTKFQSIE